MELSLFKELDHVRVDLTRGKETRTIGRIVFTMMFFMTRSGDPELRRQLLEAEAYCRKLVPLEHYRWSDPDGEPGLLDLSISGNPRKSVDTLRSNIEKNNIIFSLMNFDETEGEAADHYLHLITGRREDLKGNQTSFQFSFSLPWLEARGREGFVQGIFTDLTNILQPLHAQGGLSMATARDLSWMQELGAEAIYPLLHKFPGLMNGQARNMRRWVGTKMQPPSWLNAVHEDLLNECGWRDAVLAQLDIDGYEYADYDSGLIIQAGPTPQLGNRETGEGIPHYGKLARALKPARIDPPTGGRKVASDYQIPGSWPGGWPDEDMIAKSQAEYLARLDDQ